MKKLAQILKICYVSDIIDKEGRRRGENAGRERKTMIIQNMLHGPRSL